MYIDYSRASEDEGICLYSENDIYELETQDLPLECPYRQIFLDFGLYRSPQGPQGQPPSAPPNFTPEEPQAQQFGATPFVDQGAIKPCVFRFVYIWPRRGNGFWAWLTFVGRRSVSGFRWSGNRWRYFGMDLRDIRSFRCF
jgi:hypothetical protein